ncbi:MFS transporter [Agromyces sp. S2-1-8]|uniref:MFS transporter n=1 Tax=unclassified Agromyces TaxID=2639701 RepID=UPI001E57D2BD|nr:MFS transporter [Agromyces sp. S2-1-8]MCD5348092.1 MFS transporter [Agromyces sp. S2-1-8]
MLARSSVSSRGAAVRDIQRRAPLSADFSRLWVAQGAGVAAAQVAELALPLLAVLMLNASALELGLLGVARWLPFLLLALPLGVLVDRHRRRPMIVISDWGRAALTVAIIALAVAGVLTTPALLLLAAAIGCFTVLFEVSYQSIVPSVVPPSGLERANSRLAATAAAVQVGGPGLGGMLVQLISAPLALLVTAVGYVVSAVSVTGIRAPESPSTSRAGFATELREGMSYVRRDKYLVANLGFSALYNPFIQWVMVLFLLHAVEQLGLDAFQVGLILAIGATGALAGSLLAGPLVRRFGAGRPILWTAVAECFVLLLLPVADASWGAPTLVIVLGLVFAVGDAGATLSSVILITIRQLRTPDHLLGRVNASMRWVSYGTIAFGAAAGGIVGELVGTQLGILIGVLLTFSAVIWVALGPLPRVGDPTDLAIAERREQEASALAAG